MLRDTSGEVGQDLIHAVIHLRPERCNRAVDQINNVVLEALHLQARGLEPARGMTTSAKL
jgi:hypothetical protein